MPIGRGSEPKFNIEKPSPLDQRERPTDATKREKFSGAVVEEQILTPDEQGRVASEQWQETEFHPTQYERFIERQREGNDDILLAKYESQAVKKDDKKPEARSLGLALRVDVWRETKSDRSPIVGIVVREVYAKRGTRTDMRPGDIIIVNDEGEIAPTTKDGKEVPAIFRTRENVVKISLLMAQQMEGVTAAARRNKMIAQGAIGGGPKKKEQAA